MVGRQGKGSAEREAEECGVKEGQDTVPLAVHTTVGLENLSWGSRNALTAPVIIVELCPRTVMTNLFSLTVSSLRFLFSSLHLLPSLAINLSEWNHTIYIPPNLFTNQKIR